MSPTTRRVSPANRGNANRRENFWLLPLVFGIAVTLLQCLTNTRYGYFRDEFYYIACGEHLAFGYVDHPPLIALMAKLTRLLFGDSVSAIRVFPALLNGALVFLSGLLAWEMGGKRFAQSLTCLAVLFSPTLLAECSFLSMNSFELVFVACAVWLLVRLVKTQDGKTWLPIGVLLGIGLLNKHSMLFFAGAFLIGLLVTPERRLLRDRRFALAIGLGLLLFLPNVIWQIQNHWPTLEFLRNAGAKKNLPVSPLEFALKQILQVNPLAFPLWLAGLVWLLTSETARRFRFLGISYAVLFLFFMATKGKDYYLAPAYPMLFAAGGTAIERFSTQRRRFWLRPVTIALAVSGIVPLPLALPVLPQEQTARYVKAFGINTQSERSKTGKLPQNFADRFGWEELTTAVAGVYNALPAADRKQCVIFAGNYGEAGAISFLGRRYGLPDAVSGHNNYYLWGPGKPNPNVVIAIGPSREDLEKDFGSVTQAAVHSHAYAMPYESDLPIFVCRQPKTPLSKLWHRVKVYI